MPGTHELRLDGQRALVTGANSGIGAAVAKALAEAGAKVVINYVANEDRAEELAHEISAAGGDALPLRADVSREDEVSAMFARMTEAWGGVDILVNNAGMLRDAAFVDMTLDDWNAVLNVNLTGQFLCAREAARAFLRQGIRPEISAAAGKIVCMASVHDAIPWAGHVNYATSKGGVGMFMKTIAQELAPHRIRVNAISPGAIKTDMNRDVWEDDDSRDRLLELVPYGRMGRTEDIAKGAVWLASDHSDYVTGATIYIDGGMMLYPGFADNG